MTLQERIDAAKARIQARKRRHTLDEGAVIRALYKKLGIPTVRG